MPPCEVSRPLAVEKILDILLPPGQKFIKAALPNSRKHIQ